MPKSLVNNTLTKHSPGPILRWPSSSEIYVSLGDKKKHIQNDQEVWEFWSKGASELLLSQDKLHIL